MQTNGAHRDSSRTDGSPSYDVAIVGGGPAGLAAAANCRMRGLRSITFEAQEFGGQLVNLYPSKPVTNFPAHVDVASGVLARSLADQAARFGAELCEHEPVDFVERGRDGAGFVVTTSGRTVTASALLLALGLGRFSPRKLGLENEDLFLGRGLVYRLPPRENIGARRALVVGGGDTAVDTAIALKAVVPQVTLVHRRATFRALEHSLERLAASGVRVLTDAEVVELRGDGALEQVVVARDNEESIAIPVDLMLVSVGQVPNIGGVNQWGLRLELLDGHLPVSSAMQTAVDGVFAAGDFVAYPGKVKMIVTAVAEGSTAAASIERYAASLRPS